MWRVTLLICALWSLALSAYPALAQGRIANRAKSANQRKLAAQRKYVTTYQLPPTSQIPVAPEGLSQAAPSPASVLELAGVAEPAASVAAPAAVLAQLAPSTPPPVPARTPIQASYENASPPVTAYMPPPGQPYVPPPATPYVPPPAVPYVPPPATPLLPPPTTPAPTWPYPQALQPELEKRPCACELVIPPGYMLVPATPTLALTPAIERTLLASELAIVNAQLGQLRRERNSIAGPIVQMALGYGGMAAASVVALGTYAAAKSSDAGAQDQETLKRTAYAFTGVAAVGLILGLSGTVRLIRHAADNRALHAQIKPLMNKRANLLRRLAYGATPGPRQLQVAVQGRF